MRKWRCHQCRRLHFRDGIACSSCGAPRDDSQVKNDNDNNNNRQSNKKSKLKKKTNNIKDLNKSKKEKKETLLAKEEDMEQNHVINDDNIEKNIEKTDSGSSDNTDRYYVAPDYYYYPESGDGVCNHHNNNDINKDIVKDEEDRDDDSNNDKFIRSSNSKAIIDNLNLVDQQDDNILYYSVDDVDEYSLEEAIKRQYREDTEEECLALKRISKSIKTHEACQGCHCGDGDMLLRSDSMSSLTPEYTNRLRDFKYAREKRQNVYGDHSPWGILGMFEFLAGIRTDIEWADEICKRRTASQPYISWSTYDSKKHKQLNKPLFTYCLVGICTIMMIDAIRLNNWQFESLKINPMFGPSAEVLLHQGAKSTNEIVNNGEIGRLITPMFLHAGLIHYVLNMLALKAIGCAVEQCHGTLAASIIFCLPAIGGTILSALFLPEYISVGASGGIFGFIGACLADIAMNWKLLFSSEVNIGGQFTHHMMMVFWLILDIGLNCMIGLTPFVDNFNHMGGLLYGFICGLALMDSISMNPKTPADNNEIKKKFRIFSCSLIIAVCLISSSIALFTGDGLTSPYPAAKYASCVEFPPWKDTSSKWWYCDACGDTTADVSIMNDDEHYYSDMILHCPDGTSVELDISELKVNDETWLGKQLPTFCRNNCGDISY